MIGRVRPLPAHPQVSSIAPGHLGELTQLLPFEMVDEALAATRAVQSRLRDLPSRVVVYLVLAKRLFGARGGRRAYEEEMSSEALLEIEAAASDPDFVEHVLNPEEAPDAPG